MYTRQPQPSLSNEKLSLQVFVLGDLFTNSYLVYDESTKNGFLVDIPCSSRELTSFIKKERINLLFIALTHAHFDHIGGLGSISVPFYIHEKDVPLLKDSHLNGSYFFDLGMAIKDEPLLYDESSVLKFGSHSVQILYVPGHTPGSVALKVGKWLFSGDTLFFDSIGRTDIPLGSSSALLKSIKEKILTLPPETAVWPGHGSSTTVGREKKENPFLID